MGADENAAIMRRAYEAFNAGDIDTLTELFDESALDWNQGTAGSSAVKVIRPMTLDQGDRRFLFEAGPLTFTAFCKPASSGQMEPNVEVTTSQDHAALVQDSFRFTQRDLLVGQTGNIFGPNVASTTERNINDVDFTATAPDHTVVTGIFSLGVNLGNDAGKCLFGGHAAVGQ